MTGLRNLLRALFRHDALNAEMNDEMRQHLERATERLVARGIPRGEAEAQARREFGNVGVLTEQGRDARGAGWVEGIRRDVRLALRSLRASPGFATVAVLSLAIGIGANGAIFGLVNAVLLRSLPVTAPDELVRISIRDSMPVKKNSIGLGDWTNPIWESVRDLAANDARFAVSAPVRFNLADGGEVRNTSALWVNGDFFNTLGVRPIAGRVLSAADDYRGCPATVVASESFWTSELGANPAAIGRPVTLSGRPYTLVGVVSRDFYGVDVGSAAQLYVPVCAEPVSRGEASALDQRTTWWLRVIARPRPGVTRERLQARMSQLSRPVLEQNASPRFDATRRAEFTSMKFYVSPAGRGLSALRTRYTTPLLVLMGMVAVILLISCANVANLLLARGAARAREFAVRTAIGASRWQLVRQSLAESAILAVAGTLGGGVFATWAIRVLVAMLERGPGNGPSAVELDLSPDLRLLVFATGICAITVLLFGLAPAWRSTNVDPQSAMKSGGRGTSEGHRFRIGKSLVVAQTALALILVVCAGLLVTTFRNVATKPMGFDPENVLFARLDFSRASVPRSQERAALVGLRTRLATMPGVQAVSAADLTPVSGSSWNDAVTAEGGRRWTSLSDRLAWFNKVDSGYFAALRTRLIAGRDFGAADGPATSKVAIVNEAMAHHFFGNQSPIGRVFYTEDMGQRGDRTTIIGVVENARYQSMRDPEEPVIYLTYLQDAPAERAPSQLVIRAASTSAAIAGVKSLAASIDPRISLTFVQFTDQIAQAVQRERMLAMLSGFFGTLALVLAMVGLYGVMAYTVARRRVEMGIRIALGAARGRVLRLVLGDVGRLLAIGIVLGSAGAFALVRLLRSLLYGIEAYDPGTLVAAIALLAAAGLVAGAIPARRAAALQPVEALRED